MKKLISFVCAMAMVMWCFSAGAAENTEPVNGQYSSGKLIIRENKAGSTFAVLNTYDNGKLCGSANAMLINGEYQFDFQQDNRDKSLRVVYCGDKAYDVTLTTPAPTAVPTPTPEAQPKRTPYPEVYEKTLDAIHAPAVVTEVYSTEIDGENACILNMLHHGVEIKTTVSEGVLISSAPDKHSYLIGKETDSLKQGDVIHFLCNLQGKIKEINVIYRPDFVDYISDDVSMSNLTGSDGYSEYVFGAAVKKYNGALLVADSAGRTGIETVSKNAFIYETEKTRNGAYTSLVGKGPQIVELTGLAKSAFDEDNNVVSWEDAYDIVYVLLRKVRSVATDVIVFGSM